MRIVTRNNWDIYFHPLFAKDYVERQSKVVRLKEKLPYEDYKSHSDVKLFGNIANIINNVIPNEPLANYFVLKDELKTYSRVKGKGLPDRYRLFFKVFADKQSIVILWLGYPRKEGSKIDCYSVFKDKVRKGEFPSNFNNLMSIVEEFSGLHPDFTPPSLEYRLTAEYLAGQGYSNVYSTFLSDYGQLAKRYATTLQIELTRSFLIKHFPNCVRKRK